MELCNVEPLIDKSLSHFLVLADWNKIRFLFVSISLSVAGPLVLICSWGSSVPSRNTRPLATLST